MKLDAGEILDRIPGPIAVLTPAGGIDASNRHFVEQCGAASADDLSRVVGAFAQAMAAGAPCEQDIELGGSDGRGRWFRASGTPVRDAAGAIAGWYVLLTARDDRARIDALISGMAHDVNQPLSGIVTNAGTCLRMLDADPPNVAGARETAKRTLRDANRASDVIAGFRTAYASATNRPPDTKV